MMFLQDFKYALRLLAKRPGFTLLTILVMATGLGLSVYLFSFLHIQIFRELPFEDGDTIVQVYSTQNAQRIQGMVNLHDLYEIRNNVRDLEEYSAYKDISLNVAGRDGARRYSAVAAEPNIFEFTRVDPLLGRGFRPADNEPSAEPVVVIGFDAWQNQFGGSEQVIDSNLRINGETYRVIGVMPEGYFFPVAAEMWVTLREDAGRMNRGESSDVFGLAHLSSGADMAEINQQISVIMQRIEERYPKSNTGIGAYIEYIPRAVVGDGLPVVYSMHVIAILILVLASINVGNLLLSRAVERGKETAIRVALGAPQYRLVSQMLWESIIICTIGGVIGMLVLAWGLELTGKLTASFSVDRPPFWWDFSFGSYSLKLSLMFLGFTIILTGFLPAWKNVRSDFNAVLRDGTRGAQSKKAGRLNRVLVISEIFVSMTVLIAAGVMAVVNFKAVRADYGAETAQVLTSTVALTESTYDTPEKMAEFTKTLESRLENSVGIGDVMILSELPGVYAPTPAIALEGMEYTEDRGYPTANYVVVTPGSLAKLGVDLRSGRYLNSSDDGLGKRTVVVTDSFVSRHFPNESALGKRVRLVDAEGDEPQWLTIVGIVEHTPMGGSYEEKGRIPTVFRPFSQDPRNQVTVAMKMKADKPDVVRTLRETLGSIDPEIPAFRIELYDEVIGRQTKPMMFISTVFLLFGIAAAVLASSGIYGVMANTINQKTQEIGVKRALGATEERITKEFLKKGISQLLWGGIPGLLLGCAMGFGMAQVFPLGKADLPMVATVLTALIAGVVILASFVPTRKAIQMEPSQALRYE